MKDIKDPELALAFGKAAVATTWHDGRVGPKLLSCMKDKVFQLTALDDDLRGFLWLYQELDFEKEVSYEEVLEDLLASCDDEKQMLMAYQELIALILSGADKRVESRTESLRKTFKDVTNDQHKSACKAVEPYLKSVSKAADATGLAATRKLNKIIFDNRDKDNPTKPLRSGQIQQLCIGGVLMAHIGNIDEDLDWREVGTVNIYIRKHLELNAEQCRLLADQIMKQDTVDADLIRVCRMFHEISSLEARRRLIDSLIAIAHADKVLLKDENHAINQIARLLRVPAVRYAD